ncbi:FAD-dependent oxidoreductase, partial [Rhodococcus sp. LB1]|uniref:FAD-dependent oxidoreductase n=1 Tax=Rhodococcus sp. LB1 TaxID=1807499 RepID=UPI000AC589CB
DGGRYRPCIACNYCIDRLAAGPVPCSVNPWVGRELEQPSKPADVAVRVAVVGGGPSGMAAARDLALAGHRVDLYDERGSLGGDFALASRLHEYPEYSRIVDWYLAEIADLDITCHTGARVDAAALAELDFDAVVLATGGRGPQVDLPGADTRRVRDVREFLEAGDPAPEAVTIFGADREAAAVADDLLQHGTEVVMIGPQETIAHDVGRRGKIVLLPRLAASANLTTHLSSIVTRIEEDRVVISTAGDERVVDAPGELLISHGVEPRTDLLAAVRALAPRLGVHTVGDASGDGGSIHAALVTAADVAAKITAAAEAREEVSA